MASTPNHDASPPSFECLAAYFWSASIDVIAAANATGSCLTTRSARRSPTRDRTASTATRSLSENLAPSESITLLMVRRCRYLSEIWPQYSTTRLVPGSDADSNRNMSMAPRRLARSWCSAESRPSASKRMHAMSASSMWITRSVSVSSL